MSNDTDENATTVPLERNASFLQVCGAVCWSFLGIRKRALGERDTITIRPMHVIAAGLLGAALFVAFLVTLVFFITRHA